MENYEKELKENPPIEVEELPKRPGELWFASLSDGEKFQLVTRYLNDIAVFNKNDTLLLAQIVNLLKYICEHLGIDVAKKEKETTAKMKKVIEDNIEEAKQKLKRKA